MLPSSGIPRKPLVLFFRSGKICSGSISVNVYESRANTVSKRIKLCPEKNHENVSIWHSFRRRPPAKAPRAGPRTLFHPACKAKKTAAGGCPPAATGSTFNRICSLLETRTPGRTPWLAHFQPCRCAPADRPPSYCISPAAGPCDPSAPGPCSRLPIGPGGGGAACRWKSPSGR